jgi:dUTP pyrophosphatase
MESGERLYRANANAHFSGGIGDTVRTRLAMKRYDNELKISLKKLSPEAVLPEYAHGPEEDAGMDLRSIAAVVLAPGVPQAVPTGIAIALPSGYEAQVRPRSGLALKHAITVPNAPATIDPGYRGEIRVILLNAGSAEYKIEKGDRIAQLVIARYEAVEWEEGELNETVRGAGGFGSSGR